MRVSGGRAQPGLPAEMVFKLRPELTGRTGDKREYRQFQAAEARL